MQDGQSIVRRWTERRRYPAGHPSGRGGQFAPKNASLVGGNAVTDSLTDKPEQGDVGRAGLGGAVRKVGKGKQDDIATVGKDGEALSSAADLYDSGFAILDIIEPGFGKEIKVFLASKELRDATSIDISDAFNASVKRKSQARSGSPPASSSISDFMSFDLEDVPPDPRYDGVKGVFLSTLKSIDKVHKTEGLPQIPVKVTNLLERTGASGSLYLKRGEKGSESALVADRIELSYDSKLGTITFAHEIGHLLDNMAFAEGARPFASDESKSQEWKNWRKAVRKTKAIKVLEEIKSNPNLGPVARKHIDYLTDAREVWARSYAQYVAVKSGDIMLKSHLNQARTGWVPEQWEDEDFKPVILAIDAIFRKKGWLKE